MSARESSSRWLASLPIRLYCPLVDTRAWARIMDGSLSRRGAGRESPRTTKLYDRTGDEMTLDEVERITI